MKRIGGCDVCDIQDTEVALVICSGIETYACDKCRGIEPETNVVYLEEARVGITEEERQKFLATRPDQAEWDALLADVAKLVLASNLSGPRRATATLGALLAVLQIHEDLSLGLAKAVVTEKLALFYDDGEVKCTTK